MNFRRCGSEQFEAGDDGNKGPGEGGNAGALDLERAPEIAFRDEAREVDLGDGAQQLDNAFALCALTAGPSSWSTAPRASNVDTVTSYPPSWSFSAILITGLNARQAAGHKEGTPSFRALAIRRPTRTWRRISPHLHFRSFIHHHPAPRQESQWLLRAVRNGSYARHHRRRGRSRDPPLPLGPNGPNVHIWTS